MSHTTYLNVVGHTHMYITLEFLIRTIVKKISNVLAAKNKTLE